MIENCHLTIDKQVQTEAAPQGLKYVQHEITRKKGIIIK